MRPATNCLCVFLFYVSIVLSSIVVLLPFRRKPHLPSPMHSTKFKICSGDFCFFPSSLALSTEFPKMGKVFGKNLVLPVIIAFKLLSQVETCFQSFRWPVPYVLKHKRRFEQSLLKKRRKYVYMSLYIRITNKVARRITNFYPADLNIPL